VVAELRLDPARRSAQTLAPAIAELLAGQQVAPQQVNLVAVAVGPGSFTGLRVGVTTAKTFAYAVGAQVMGVSTLEVIGLQAAEWLLTGPPEEGAAVGSAGARAAAGREVHALLDALRGELFVGRFRIDALAGAAARALIRMAGDELLAYDTWLARLPAGAAVSGPGVQRVAARLPAGVMTAPETLWEPRAATVGRLAWRDYENGRRDDLWKLAPAYLRPSYAEEKAGRPPIR
jgi:tRNA threonylcarbamoyladenosine biosynthesis protein TsaB